MNVCQKYQFLTLRLLFLSFYYFVENTNFYLIDSDATKNQNKRVCLVPNYPI